MLKPDKALLSIHMDEEHFFKQLVEAGRSLKAP